MRLHNFVSLSDHFKLCRDKYLKQDADDCAYDDDRTDV